MESCMHSDSENPCLPIGRNVDIQAPNGNFIKRNQWGCLLMQINIYIQSVPYHNDKPWAEDDGPESKKKSIYLYLL